MPGEADYERDGLPRVFDCHLDAPTYRFIRGEETMPVKDELIAPGLPSVLTSSDLRIESVVLPATAHNPGLRPWILENELKQANAAVAKARATLADAQKKLTQANETTKLSPAETEKADRPVGAC